MTAEIAIMNANAVALAADSAVTLGTEGQQKVFDSANKLFALSKYHPIGIMVYGSAAFMGIPWETIIKMYREQLEDSRFPTLREQASDFERYLSTAAIIGPEQQSGFVRSVASFCLDRIRNELLSRVRQAVETGRALSPSDIAQLLKDVIESEKAPIEAWSNLESMDSAAVTSFMENFGQLLDSVIDEKLENTPRDADDKVAISLLICQFIARASLSDQGTSGVVIAGFGSEELFPSIRNFELDAVVSGRLRRSHYNDDSVRFDRGAVIMPFAQREMVDRFMAGIDPDYRLYLRSFLQTVLKDYGDLILAGLQVTDVNRLRIVSEELSKAREDIAADFLRVLDEYSRGYWGPIIDIVSTLPKDELASMAEALVNLTSLKRRVSASAQTVGGPIDVAVISKGDGLIWIRRKHYFRPELNRQFFDNYYRRG